MYYTFRLIAAVDRCTKFYNNPSFYLLYLHILASVYTSEMRYTGKILCMYMCPVPNGFRERDISLYSSKIDDKKETLHTVSNSAIYCSCDKVGKLYLIKYIFENSSVNINALCNSCEDMAWCSSECILTLFYAGDNIYYVIQQFVSCIHFSSVYFILHPNP
jgi:hypothetical protein